MNENLSPISVFFRNKLVRLALVADILVIFVIVGLAIYNATKTATISFYVSPLDATISVNGSSNYENNNVFYRLSPGTYKVQLSHPDLDSKNFTIEIEPHSNVIVRTFLSKDGNFNFYTRKDRQNDFYLLSEIASKDRNITTDSDTSAEDFIVDYDRRFKLLTSSFPITYSEYKESATSRTGQQLSVDITIQRATDGNCVSAFCLQALMLGTDDKDFIKTLLKKKGLNPEDFEIEYKIY